MFQSPSEAKKCKKKNDEMFKNMKKKENNKKVPIKNSLLCKKRTRKINKKVHLIGFAAIPNGEH